MLNYAVSDDNNLSKKFATNYQSKALTGHRSKQSEFGDFSLLQTNEKRLESDMPEKSHTNQKSSASMTAINALLKEQSDNTKQSMNQAIAPGLLTSIVR